MLTIVMCDDDIGFLQQLYDRTEEIMQKFDIEYSIKEFDNGRETVAYCRENGADMILADIDIPRWVDDGHYSGGRDKNF